MVEGLRGNDQLNTHRQKVFFQVLPVVYLSFPACVKGSKDLSYNFQLMIECLFQLRLEVVEFGESWIIKGALLRVGPQLRFLLKRSGSNLTIQTAQQFT